MNDNVNFPMVDVDSLCTGMGDVSFYLPQGCITLSGFVPGHEGEIYTAIDPDGNYIAGTSVDIALEYEVEGSFLIGNPEKIAEFWKWDDVPLKQPFIVDPDSCSIMDQTYIVPSVDVLGNLVIFDGKYLKTIIPNYVELYE